MIKKNALFLSLLVVLSATNCFAWENVTKWREAWGGKTPDAITSYNRGGAYQLPGTSIPACSANVLDLLNAGSNTVYNGVNTTACIGFSRDKDCDPRATNGGGWDDEYVTLMMIATTLEEHGAQFCPVQVLSKNKNKKNSWIKFQDNPFNDTSKCAWLCQKGWTGSKCGTAVKEGMKTDVDAIELKPANFSDIKVYDASDRYNTYIPTFEGWDDKTCGQTPEEHGIVLAVVGWLNSGHGAFVRQIVVRAHHDGSKNMKSDPYFYPAQNTVPMLVCKNGYKPNDQETDCVLINPPLTCESGYKPNEEGTDCVLINPHLTCESGYEPNEEGTDCVLITDTGSGTTTDGSAPVSETSLCTGWRDSFNEDIHEFYKGSDSNCYVYRCKTPGFGFADDRKVQCVDCTSSVRNGIDTVTGKCIKCSSGEIFDTRLNRCKKLKQISMDQLLYGNKSATSTDKPCWQMFGDEYTDCVLNKAPTTTSSK